MPKLLASIIILTFLAFNSGLTSAAEPIPGLSFISAADIRQSAIEFVNFNTSPGLEGATLDLDKDNRQSTNWRTSLGFSAEFTLRNHIFDGYWGLAVVGGQLKDKIKLINDQGQTVQLNLQRQVAALRGSFGLSFPINEHFKLRPYLTLIASDLRSNGNFENLSTAPATDSFNSSAWMYSTVASLDAIYHQWYGEYKLETNVQYHLIYTDSFSEDNPYLATSDWNDALNMKVAISGPTPFKTLTRPWRWQTYAKYTNFLNNNEFALGYSQLIEVGAGLDWQINIKPLDWFGWQSLGLKLGVIFGDDVEGYNFGLTAQ